jgi:hypothetical protein
MVCLTCSRCVLAVHRCRGVQAADYLATNLEAHLRARWHSAQSAGELLAAALADADAAFRAQQDAVWADRWVAGGGVQLLLGYVGFLWVRKQAYGEWAFDGS